MAKGKHSKCLLYHRINQASLTHSNGFQLLTHYKRRLMQTVGSYSKWLPVTTLLTSMHYHMATVNIGVGTTGAPP